MPIVCPAHLDAGDLGDRVRFVGRLEGTGQQILFLDRLRRHLGIDAAAAEELEALHAGSIGRVDDVGLDEDVAADEIGRIGIVGVDPSDPRRRHDDIVGFLFGKEPSHRRPVLEIELGVCSQHEILEALPFQRAHERRADEAAVARDEDLGVALHRARAMPRLVILMTLSFLPDRDRVAVLPEKGVSTRLVEVVRHHLVDHLVERDLRDPAQLGFRLARIAEERVSTSAGRK